MVDGLVAHFRNSRYLRLQNELDEVFGALALHYEFARIVEDYVCKLVFEGEFGILDVILNPEVPVEPSFEFIRLLGREGFGVERFEFGLGWILFFWHSMRILKLDFFVRLC